MTFSFLAEQSCGCGAEASSCLLCTARAVNVLPFLSQRTAGVTLWLGTIVLLPSMLTVWHRLPPCCLLLLRAMSSCCCQSCLSAGMCLAGLRSLNVPATMDRRESEHFSCRHNGAHAAEMFSHTTYSPLISAPFLQWLWSLPYLCECL